MVTYYAKALVAPLTAAVLLSTPAAALEIGSPDTHSHMDMGASTNGLLDVGWMRSLERWLDSINFSIGYGPRGLGLKSSKSGAGTKALVFDRDNMNAGVMHGPALNGRD